MRVSINHGEYSKGLVFGKKRHTITVKVDFTEAERHIIASRNLGADIILERIPPVDAKVTQVKGIGSALKVVSGLGKTENGYNLRIRDLLKGADTYTVETPVQAKTYENALIDNLRELKEYLEGNAENATNKSFEL